MSVREYVGARYVPIVVGEWDNTREYEPLMVVIHEGNSYVSRQYVPTGIDIQNEQYWIESANYNAQVDAYRKEVQAFDGRITANEQAVDAEKTRAENAEQINATAIAKEKTRAENAEQINATAIAKETTNRQNADIDIANVLNQIQPLDAVPTQGSTKGVTSGGMYTAIDSLNIPQMKTQITDLRELTYVDTSKIALIFGDSIARGYGTSNPGSTGWANRLANRLGITAYNFAVDGASFQYNIKDQVITAHNSTTFNDADVAYVFVSGGINDHGHTYNDIANGLTSFFNNIQTYYPQAQVVFLPLLCAAKPLDSIDQGDQQYLHSYSGMFLLQICHTATWPNTCIISDGYTWLQGFPDAAADQVHPNDAGAQIIANNVYSLLRFGYLPPVLTVGEVILNSDISKIVTSDSYTFWEQNDKLYNLHGRIKFSDVSSLEISQDIFTVPNAMWGRQNQTMMIEFVSNSEVFYAYLMNTVAKFWTLPTKANTDYYFSYFGLVGI